MLRRFALGFLFLLAAGCLWRSYAYILDVHVDVLTQMADKLAVMTEAGKGPTAETMAEYVYPAKRARTFLRQFDGYEKRASYHRFRQLLERYEALVREVDAARALGTEWKSKAPQIRRECDALQQMAVAIRADSKAGN
jgi:hypothetical protein